MNWKSCLVWLLKDRQKNPKKTTALFPQNIRSILIRPLGKAIGDAAVHTAHIQQIRQVYPNAQIGVIVNPKTNLAIFNACGMVDKFITRKFTSYVKERNKWDLFLDFENNFNSSSLFMDMIINPRLIVIFRKYDKKHYNLQNIRNYDFYCPQDDLYPLSHYVSNSIFNQIYKLNPPNSVLNVNAELKEKMKGLWNNKKVRILLCPQGSKRELPPKELAELLNKSLDNNKEQINFIISYTSSSQNYFYQLTKLTDRFDIKSSPPTNLEEYIALIASADLVIAVDGGSLHLACALKKPLLSFFANSEGNLQRWTPLIAENVPSLRLISQDTNTSSDQIGNFNLNEAITWLRKQVASFL